MRKTPWPNALTQPYGGSLTYDILYAVEDNYSKLYIMSRTYQLHMVKSSVHCPSVDCPVQCSTRHTKSYSIHGTRLLFILSFASSKSLSLFRSEVQWASLYYVPGVVAKHIRLTWLLQRGVCVNLHLYVPWRRAGKDRWGSCEPYIFNLLDYGWSVTNYHSEIWWEFKRGVLRVACVEWQKRGSVFEANYDPAGWSSASLPMTP